MSAQNQSRLQSYIAKAAALPSVVKKEEVVLPTAVFTVPTTVAIAALKGFMPFGGDLEKQQRYKTFLEAIVEASRVAEQGGQEIEKNLLERDKVESREFSKAAMIYRPLSQMIASRFTNETGLVEVKIEPVPFV